MNPYRKLMEAIVRSYQIERDLRMLLECPNHAELTAEVKRLSREKTRSGELFKTYEANVSFLCCAIKTDRALGYYVFPARLKDYYPTIEQLSNRSVEKSPEMHLTNLLANVHNQYCDLPVTHLADNVDWTFHLHSLQRILMSRIARKDYQDFFYSIKKEAAQ